MGAERSATEIFIGEKEKLINKGTDKQYVAVLLLHNTTNHYQALYQRTCNGLAVFWPTMDLAEI